MNDAEFVQNVARSVEALRARFPDSPMVAKASRDLPYCAPECIGRVISLVDVGISEMSADDRAEANRIVMGCMSGGGPIDG